MDPVLEVAFFLLTKRDNLDVLKTISVELWHREDILESHGGSPPPQPSEPWWISSHTFAPEHHGTILMGLLIHPHGESEEQGEELKEWEL